VPPPSDAKIQPWKVHIVTGEMRRRLEEQVLAHRETRPDDGTAEFARSSKRKEPYISRMRALDKELDSISLLDIGMFMQTFMLAAKDVGSTPAPRSTGRSATGP